MRNTQILRRNMTLLLAGVLFCSVITSTLSPRMVYAAGYKDLTVRKQSEIWVLSRAVSECIKERGFESGNKRESDLNQGQWLNGQVGYDDPVNMGEWSADLSEGSSDDSQSKCVPTAIATLRAMGVSAVDAICTMNQLAGKEIWKRIDGGGDCRSGATDLDFDEDNNGKNDTDIWNRFVRDYMEVDSIEGALTKGMRYVIYSENFYQECSKDNGESWGSPREWKSGDKESDKVYKLKWNLSREDNNSAGADKDWYIVSGGNNRDHEVHIDGYSFLYNDDKATCEELSERINEHAAAYLAEIKSDTDSGAVSNPGGSTGGSAQPTCESEGGTLAWVLCGVLRLMDSTISFLDQKVNELLFIDSDVYDSRSIKNATGSIQNIALLILVPIMIFMVIGTALNFGPFDPYTVKKALPRMFIAAIFIVLSLPITQFGVELSNSVGQGLGNLIVSAVPADQRIDSLQDILSPGEAGGFTALTIVGVAGAAATGALTIGIAASIALVTLIALLLGFVILVMRQVLLLMLIVVAPLAILAWIFPGNDKLWGIWKTTFIAMLMMYPIIAILIASGKFVAGIAAF